MGRISVRSANRMVTIVCGNACTVWKNRRRKQRNRVPSRTPERRASGSAALARRSVLNQRREVGWALERSALSRDLSRLVSRGSAGAGQRAARSHGLIAIRVEATRAPPVDTAAFVVWRAATERASSVGNLPP